MSTSTFLTVASVLIFLAAGIYLVAAYKDTIPVVSGSILITAGIIGIPIALLFVGLYLLPYLSSRSSRTCNNTRSTKQKENRTMKRVQPNKNAPVL